MKKLIALMLLLLTFAVSTTLAQEVKYKLNPKTSKIEWKGRKMLGEHIGTINFKSGELVFTNNKLTGGTFIVDMTTIKNTDLEDKDLNAKLVNHLKSDDFFNVDKYPEAKLVFTRMDKKIKNDYFIVAKLYLKGKTSEIKIPATLNFDGSKVTSRVMTSFDRSLHDVKYGSKSFFEAIGDKIIYDDIDLNVYIEAEK